MDCTCVHVRVWANILGDPQSVQLQQLFKQLTTFFLRAFHSHLTGVEFQGTLLDLALFLFVLWRELDHITEHAWLEVHPRPLLAADAVEQDVQPTRQDACVMRVA